MAINHDHWVEMFSGTAVDLKDPKPAQILLGDIAVHLSKLCRFNGACRGFYSVAQHSYEMVEEMRTQVGMTPADLRWALLHDAHEAIVSDVPRPVLRFLEEGEFDTTRADLIARLDEAILLAAEVNPESIGIGVRAKVKVWDTRMLASEAHHLLRTGGADWGLPAEAVDHVRLMGRRVPHTPPTAASKWLVAAQQLGLKVTAEDLRLTLRS